MAKMRRYFAYIKESYDENFPEGHVLIYDSPSQNCLKGQERAMYVCNMNNLESKKVAWVVGLGYADFKDEKDFEQRMGEVVKNKLKDIGVVVEDIK